MRKNNRQQTAVEMVEASVRRRPAASPVQARAREASKRPAPPAGMAAVLALTSMLALSACSNGKLSEDRLPADNAIEFSAGAGAESRGTATTAAELRKIGVFGYSHTGSFGSDLTARFPDYFLNQAVTGSVGAGTWSYSGVRKYWPREGVNVSFFAYAPYIDVENTFTLYPRTLSNMGAPTIAYTVPAALRGQIDLLWGRKTEMTYASSNGGKVDFMMDHALTRVDFQVKLDDGEKGRPFLVKIHEFTVKNVTDSGMLDLSKAPGDAGLWTTVRPGANAGWSRYILTPDYAGGMKALAFDTRNVAPAAGEADPWSFNDLLTDGQHLMLIPQTLEDQHDGLTPAQATIKYSFINVYNDETVDREDTFALSRPTLTSWAAGQGVVYQLTLSFVGGPVVELDMQGFLTGTPWVDQNGNNPIEGGVN